MNSTLVFEGAVDGVMLGRRSLEYSSSVVRKIFAAGVAFNVSTLMAASTPGQQRRWATLRSVELLYPQIKQAPDTRKESKE